MPVILPQDDEQAWLDINVQDIKILQDLLKPYPDELMKAYMVSKKVNSPVNNVRECLLPFDENELK
jgi:putative SOS response-associated peptidase YedK